MFCIQVIPPLSNGLHLCPSMFILFFYGIKDAESPITLTVWHVYFAIREERERVGRGTQEPKRHTDNSCRPEIGL